VDELIRKAGAIPTATDTEAAVLAVYPSEVAEAREFGWLDADVEFTPFGTDAEGATVGYCEVMRGEYDALIRGNVSGFPFTHTWHCKVIGVQDDGTNVVMVLGKPYKTTMTSLTPLQET
jgi:hypothetical protein